MSFFAGRIGTKTVLSLNSASGTGNTIASHNVPNNNSIFHSDMPHVLITSEYSSTLLLSNPGNYYYNTLPSQVANLLNNDPNRVILTEVEFSNGYRHLINGMSMGVGAKAGCLIAAQWSGSQGFSVADGWCRTNIVNSGDTALDYGFFHSGTSGATVNEKLRDGTGAQHIMGARSSRGDRGPFPPIIPPQPGAIMTGCTALYKNTVSIDEVPVYIASKPITIDSSWLRHPGLRGQAFNSFYIRGLSVPRVLYGYYGPTYGDDGVPKGGSYSASNVILQPPGGGTQYSYGVGFMRGSPQTYMYWDSNTDNGSASSGNIGVYQDSYGVTPTKVTWYVTNLTYTGTSYTIDGNPFTGTSIKLSPREFIIKGVNVMNSNIKFINLVARNSNVGNRPDMYSIGSNISRSSASTPVGTIGVACATSVNAPVVLGGSIGDQEASVLSIYNFQSSASWAVNTNTNTISNQWGTVWGPTNIPLRVIGGTATATLSGSLTFIKSTSAVQLTTLSLGMGAARDGAIVCTLDFLNDDWLSSGGIGCFNPLEFYRAGANAVDTRIRTGGTNSNKKLHQILNLPVNRFVPFYVVRGNCSNNTTVTTPPYQPYALWVNALNGYNAANSDYLLVYYFKNEGNGNVSIHVGCGMNNIVGMKVALPNLRVTVQRLT